MIKNREIIETAELLPSTAMEKRDRNVRYLMELKTENLLFSYLSEAGLNGRHQKKLLDVHWGWDGPLSQIRGTFTGHWLSAAARVSQETGNGELKGKADFIVAEIARCQEANGGEWCFPIPEKYLHAIKRGQRFWAPQYVCHKAMMGLLDMYLYAGNGQALEILKSCTPWFKRFTDDISRETMDFMMDFEETGGIMEFWADLYAVTKDPTHLELMRRYERPKLFDPIFRGEDILTNMHANATIPEIHGCARAYEVTGEERYRTIAENYWDLAVNQRGCYATGGQTNAEIWTPKHKQSARLSDLNQEHCVVYNMIRLANYLYRWSGKAEYLDYIERNIENGLYAQAYWQARELDNACDPVVPDTGLIAYFLPLAPGSHKNWGSRTEHFWCCHCTLVQANARYREFIYYRAEDALTVGQYIPSRMTTEIGGVKVTVEQTETNLGGEFLTQFELARDIEDRPRYNQMDLAVKAEGKTAFALRLRLPWWLSGEMKLLLNGGEIPYTVEDGFAVVTREWGDDKLSVILPKALTCQPLDDDPTTVAFLDGPVLLAGLVGEERVLYGDIGDPYTLLKPFHERQWSQWMPYYYTRHLDHGFKFIPIKEVGKETYTVYFPVRKGSGA